MKEVNEQLLRKFFKNDCSREEARIVLDWFDKPAGKAYLNREIERDTLRALQKPYMFEISGKSPDYKKMLAAIDHYSDSGKKPPKSHYQYNQPKRDTILFYSKFAALLLAVILTSLIYLFLYTPEGPMVEEHLQTIYATGHDVQKRVSFSDGTAIEMNRNSRMVISGQTLDESGQVINEDRYVALEGEAFFNVTNNPGRSFFVMANDHVIEVLGTEFNVRNIPEEELAVSVISGTVSLGILSGRDEHERIILKKGQSAVLDYRNNEILLADTGTENFLFWKTGRWVFEDLPMESVCHHLERNYKKECHFTKPELETYRLTSSFHSDSFENTLSVIAQSMRLSYRVENDIILWIEQ